MHTKRAFTLIELLVVIAIIAILTAILLPMRNIGDKTKTNLCMNNTRQINLGMQLYADDSSGRAPRTPGTANSPELSWSGYKKVMKTYVGLAGASSPQDKVFTCPLDTFYYDVAANFQRVSKGLHEQPPDFLSYAF